MTPDKAAYDDPGASSPWTQPRFIAAAVVVGLIAVFGLVLAVTGGDDSSDRGPAASGGRPGAATSAPPARGGDDQQDSVCGLAPGDQTVPSSPPETKWELVGTFAAPTAPRTIGPGDVDDSGFRSCFAHSPTGALYAAANVLALTTEPSLWSTLAREAAAAGPGRDAAIRGLAAETPAESSTSIQLAGFSFLNYGPESATVDLAIRASTGGAGHIPLTMRWEDGDWKVVIPPDGDLADTYQSLPDLTGYVPWSGA